MQHTSLSVLFTAMVGGSALAQCFSVTTLTTAGNGQNGVMFDIVNTSAGAINIGSFDECFFSGASSNMYIYTKVGTYNGSENTPGAWTLVAGPVVTPHGLAPVLDPIPIVVNVTIPPAGVQGFYLTGDAATTVAYTTGVGQLGTVIGSNADLQVICGVGKAYPFGATFGQPTAGRLFNGRVNYCPIGGGTVLATNTTLGAGCVKQNNSFYELDGTSTIASASLSGNTLFLNPTANGYQGIWAPGTAAALFVPPVLPTTLAVGDDTTVTVTPSVPLNTPYGPQPTLNVSGNAIIGFGGVLDFPGTNTYTPTSAGFLTSACGGIYAWHDYNSAEAGSGPVLSEEIGGVLYITFNGVESYANPEVANPSTLQFQLTLATGAVRIVWVSVDGNATSAFGSTHLVGVTAPGASLDPGAITLGTATPAQLLTTSPETVGLGLAALSRPVINTSWNLNTTDIPPTGVIGVEILGLSDPAINDLFFIGMPGCGLRANLDSLNAFLVGGATHAWSFGVPNNIALLNLHIYATSAIAQVPPVNAFGFITSNGIDGKIGDF